MLLFIEKLNFVINIFLFISAWLY